MQERSVASRLLGIRSQVQQKLAAMRSRFGMVPLNGKGEQSIRRCPWRGITPTAEALSVQTMLSVEERKLLFWLGSTWFQNEGAIVDAGCFLGGSTMALAEGVKKNSKWLDNQKQKVIHSYDLFEVEDWTRGIYFPETTKAKSDFKPKYLQNIESVSDLVMVHGGDITKAAMPDESIEVLFIDLAKHWTVSDYLCANYFPKLIPGKSIVVQQDYIFNSWNCWLMATMEYYADYFEIVGDTGLGSVVFLYTKEIPESEIKTNLIGDMTRDEILNLTDLAIARFRGSQKDILLESRAQFVTVMEEYDWRE